MCNHEEKIIEHLLKHRISNLEHYHYKMELLTFKRIIHNGNYYIIGIKTKRNNRIACNRQYRRICRTGPKHRSQDRGGGPRMGTQNPGMGRAHICRRQATLGNSWQRRLPECRRVVIDHATT
jgi:hypothetical protein